MRILDIDHITINVLNLEESKHFYETVFGLKQLGFIDMGDHTLTYFELTKTTRLELIEYLSEVGETKGKETDKKRYRHFCIATDDLLGFYKICTENQVYVRKSPSFVEKLGCETMLITDPNGVEIEIIQR